MGFKELIQAMIQALISLWSEKSDLELLPEEERIDNLRHDILMQDVYEYVILILLASIIAWIIIRIRRDLAETKKTIAEKNLFDRQETDKTPAFQSTAFQSDRLGKIPMDHRNIQSNPPDKDQNNPTIDESSSTEPNNKGVADESASQMSNEKSGSY